jgi:phage shock protein PspC (stress-responsive transcriptional regulator)
MDMHAYIALLQIVCLLRVFLIILLFLMCFGVYGYVIMCSFLKYDESWRESARAAVWFFLHC